MYTHSIYRGTSAGEGGGGGGDGHTSYRRCRGVGGNMESAPAAINVVHSVDDG